MTTMADEAAVWLTADGFQPAAAILFLAIIVITAVGLIGVGVWAALGQPVDDDSDDDRPTLVLS